METVAVAVAVLGRLTMTGQACSVCGMAAGRDSRPVNTGDGRQLSAVNWRPGERPSVVDHASRPPPVPRSAGEDGRKSPKFAALV